MKRIRVTLIACSVLVVFAATLAAAPAAPTVSTTDAAFLASLASLTPAAPAVPGVGVPAPSPSSSCGTNFCANARLECESDCAPCAVSGFTCIISICDYGCWCRC
jgi:hypothetical protein